MSHSSQPNSLVDTLSDEDALLENQRVAATALRTESLKRSTASRPVKKSWLLGLATATCAAAVIVAALLHTAAEQASPEIVAESPFTQEASPAAAGVSMARSLAANTIALPVSDVAAAQAFYQDQLTFKHLEASSTQGVSLEAYGMQIVLIEQPNFQPAIRSIEVAPQDFEKIEQALTRANHAFSKDGSLKFQDPDGNIWKIAPTH